jgi:hypothetical protein
MKSKTYEARIAKPTKYLGGLFIFGLKIEPGVETTE